MLTPKGTVKDSFFDLIDDDIEASEGLSQAIHDKRGSMTFEEYKRSIEAKENPASSLVVEQKSTHLLKNSPNSKPESAIAVKKQPDSKTILEFFSELVSYRVGKRDWQKFNYPVNKSLDLRKLLVLIFRNIFGANLYINTHQSEQGHAQLIFTLTTETSPAPVQICRVTWMSSSPRNEEYVLIALMRKLGEEMAERVIKDQPEAFKHGFPAWTKGIQVIDGARGVFTGRNAADNVHSPPLK